MKRESKWQAAIVLSSVWALAGATPACGSDGSTVSPGSGGATGAGGASGGAAGKGTGATVGTGGKGNGGVGGNGGRGSGGKGGKGAVFDAGPDANGGGCTPPKIPVYEAPGCDGASRPVCAALALDACAIEVCGCDGTTLSGCGDFTKPYRHKGPCSDASAPDSGKDAH